MHGHDFEDFYNKYGEYNILFDRLNLPSYSIAYSWQKTKKKILDLSSEVIEKKLETNKKVRVLDIGCGDGGDIFRLAKKFEGEDVEFVGIELSKPFVNFANEVAKRKGFSRCEFFYQDIEKETPNGKFDLIISSEVLEHLKDPKAVLKRAYSILNKEGFILVTTPNGKNLMKYPFLPLKGLISRVNIEGATKSLSSEDKHFKTEEQHISVLNAGNLKKLLELSGFSHPKLYRGSVTFGGEWFDSKPVIYSFVILFDKILDIIPIKQTSWDLIYLAKKEK